MATNGPSDLDTEPGPAPAPPPPPSSGGGLPFFNLGRGAKGLALVMFFLPWVTVSCAGQELITMSGYDLATGTLSMRNPMTGAVESPPGSTQGGDLPVLIAAILIVASLVVTFVLKRRLAALVAMAGCALAAAAISYTVFVKVPNSTNTGPMAPGGGAGGGDAAAMGMNEQQLAEMIQINYGIGLWLTLAALVAAIVLNFLARSRASP